MSVAAFSDRLRLGEIRLLAQSRQGVVFAEHRDHRPAFTGLADDGGRDAGDILGDAEALLLEHGAMLGGRFELAIRELGHPPDAIAERDEARLLVVDEPPDLFAVAHGVS
jgi:hypothetical protein